MLSRGPPKDIKVKTRGPQTQLSKTRVSRNIALFLQKGIEKVKKEAIFLVSLAAF
jgi:hypothetical protein